MGVGATVKSGLLYLYWVRRLTQWCGMGKKVSDIKELDFLYYSESGSEVVYNDAGLGEFIPERYAESQDKMFLNPRDASEEKRPKILVFTDSYPACLEF